MGEQTEIYHFCDLCLNKIIISRIPGEYLTSGNRYIGGYQSWPVDGKVFEICEGCCSKLMGAKKLGLIDINMDKLYEFCGWKKEGRMWIK